MGRDTVRRRTTAGARDRDRDPRPHAEPVRPSPLEPQRHPGVVGPGIRPGAVRRIGAVEVGRREGRHLVLDSELDGRYLDFPKCACSRGFVEYLSPALLQVEKKSICINGCCSVIEFQHAITIY